MRKTCWGSPLHAPWEAERLCRLHMLPSSPADQKYPHTYQQRAAGIADWSIFVLTKLHHVLSVTQPGSAWEGPLEAAGAACCWQSQQRWPEGLSSQVLSSSGDGGSPSPWQPLPVLCSADKAAPDAQPEAPGCSRCPLPYRTPLPMLLPPLWALTDKPSSPHDTRIWLPLSD